MSGEVTFKFGQLKSKKQIKDKQPMKGKQSMKRQRSLIDKEDVDSSPPRFSNDAIVENFPLTAPQASQDIASTQH
ncbi:hypothetical protein FXO37_03337 [Capsicum annuum]|nr:hypothetical protein FXO37_03337 [Capsicum annuum]